MIKLRSCATPAEADLLQSLLESEGIECHLPQQDTPQPLAGFPGGFEIYVRSEDHERAVRLLATAITDPDPESPGAP